jgi:hypothetical protein
MMISEPEAGAIYAARYLKDEMGKDFLKVSNDSVIPLSFLADMA